MRSQPWSTRRTAPERDRAQWRAGGHLEYQERCLSCGRLAGEYLHLVRRLGDPLLNEMPGVVGVIDQLVEASHRSMVALQRLRGKESSLAGRIDPCLWTTETREPIEYIENDFLVGFASLLA